MSCICTFGEDRKVVENVTMWNVECNVEYCGIASDEAFDAIKSLLDKFSMKYNFTILAKSAVGKIETGGSFMLPMEKIDEYLVDIQKTLDCCKEYNITVARMTDSDRLISLTDHVEGTIKVIIDDYVAHFEYSDFSVTEDDEKLIDGVDFDECEITKIYVKLERFHKKRE